MIHVNFEKRMTKSRAMTFALPFISIAISLVLGAVVLLLSGANPITAYDAMLKGVFGTQMRLQNTINRMIPLLMCGLAVGVAFRLKFWNIGAEGQYVCGVIGITWVMQFWTFITTGPLLLLLGLIMATLFGAVWGVIPGFLKARWDVNENLTTLMMNYIAIGIAQWLYFTVWKAPMGNMGTPEYPKGTEIGPIWGKMHWGLLIALALCVILWFVMYKTKWGFELNMIGLNPNAAKCQGVSIGRNIILAMLLSGAIAGLGGGINSAAITHRLSTGVDAGYGFTGIIVAWMGGLNPFASIIFAFIIAALEIGADRLQLMTQLPAAIGDVLQGLILIPLLASSIFSDYKLRIRKTHKEVETC